MNRGLRLALTAGITSAVALVGAAPTSASETHAGKLKLTPDPQLSTFSVMFGHKYASIDSVCFTPSSPTPTRSALGMSYAGPRAERGPEWAWLFFRQWHGRHLAHVVP
jgi:hypothetical protein